jgi:hypothetical protein
MAQELNLTREETAALDRIEAELKGSPAKATAAIASLDTSELCDKYHSIRAALLILIKILKKIPVVGPKAAAALEFLMSLADAVCPA